MRVLLDINETKYIILNVLIDYMRFKQSKKCTNLLLIKWFAIVQMFNIKLQFYALASINFRHIRGRIFSFVRVFVHCLQGVIDTHAMPKYCIVILGVISAVSISYDIH